MPVRWTASGVQSLGDLPGGGTDGIAFGASSDGSAIVGYSFSGNGYEAFRWTAAGMIGLNDLPGGRFDSRAAAISGDGSTVVGTGSVGSETSPYRRAFRWTASRNGRPRRFAGRQRLQRSVRRVRRRLGGRRLRQLRERPSARALDHLGGD